MEAVVETGIPGVETQSTVYLQERRRDRSASIRCPVGCYSSSTSPEGTLWQCLRCFHTFEELPIPGTFSARNIGLDCTVTKRISYWPAWGTQCTCSPISSPKRQQRLWQYRCLCRRRCSSTQFAYAQCQITALSATCIYCSGIFWQWAYDHFPLGFVRLPTKLTTQKSE